ncbi:inositol monophosphatase family protein [Nocardia wallacei]|uniref:inositol monophosphatase family protein n=1 Tax=Nocardia wallacei TaxID=480035 RepID=UPI0024538F50|nr:inositol monophosphatase family protein [Nocardia wallacei]
MTNNLGDLLAIARAGVAQGGRLLATAERGGVHVKSDRDFVTDLDRRIEDHVRQFLERETPGWDFLGEESEDQPADPTAGRVWTLDPIDGTSNFIHGLPLCAVSLALLHDGVPVIGVIAAPFLDLEYYATAGGGAFRNDRPIHASTNEKLSTAIVSIGDYATGAEANNERRLAITATLAANVERVRMFGSAALDLVWVADGRTDACISLSNKPWDTAAGVAIARESGAAAVDLTGEPHAFHSTSTVAIAPALSGELLTLIDSCKGPMSQGNRTHAT